MREILKLCKAHSLVVDKETTERGEDTNIAQAVAYSDYDPLDLPYKNFLKLKDVVKENNLSLKIENDKNSLCIENDKHSKTESYAFKVNTREIYTLSDEDKTIVSVTPNKTYLRTEDLKILNSYLIYLKGQGYENALDFKQNDLDESNVLLDEINDFKLDCIRKLNSLLAKESYIEKTYLRLSIQGSLSTISLNVTGYNLGDICNNKILKDVYFYTKYSSSRMLSKKTEMSFVKYLKNKDIDNLISFLGINTDNVLEIILDRGEAESFTIVAEKYVYLLNKDDEVITSYVGDDPVSTMKKINELISYINTI